MSMQLIEIVLPQLAKRLHRHLERYHAGDLSDSQFAARFEGLMQRQYTWLAEQGVPGPQAAVAVHGAVLVLTEPGMRLESQQTQTPLEVIEYKAVKAAAADVARRHRVDERKTVQQLSAILAQYSD